MVCLLTPSLTRVMQILTSDLGVPKKRPAPKERQSCVPVKKQTKMLFIAQPAKEDPSTSSPTQPEVDSSSEEEQVKHKESQTSPQKVCQDHHGTFTPKIKCNNCGHYTTPSKDEIKRISKGNFIQTIQKNDATCFHYTGVPKGAFLMQLFIWLEPLARKNKLWDGNKKIETTGRSAARKRRALTTFEEFCLTLVRIRRGYDVALLSHLFGISQSHVCRILPSWINFLAKCFKSLIKWSSKDVVKANLPHAFKRYARTRVIIDCTEIYVEKAFRPAAQRATWSSYKHANTFKLLVGIMPSGAITFLSKLYSGAISDQAIVKQSKFVDKLEEGDDVMADRGFNIRHVVLKKKSNS